MNRAVLVLLIFLISGYGGCQKSSKQAENGAKEGSNQEQSNKANDGSWASDTWNGAVSTGSESLENTSQWLTSLYQAAKDQGITTASSMKEWVANDWQAQGDWQYQLISASAGDVDSIEAMLNKAGSDRWECYHVDTTGSNWTFFLKRSRRSYLSKVPLKDLANMLPLISSDGE